MVNDPLIISQLLNRELSPTVLELANELNIKIFPGSWKDLKMDCNCPDWAVPCKHLAAVIYLISRQIDGDPFLVFALRGLDLPQALRQRGFEMGRQILITPPPLSTLFTEQPFVHPQSDNQALDFTLIPDLHHELLRLLPDNPVFYPFGNFHQIYSHQLAQITRYGQRLQNCASASRHDDEWRLSAVERPTVAIDASYHIRPGGMAHFKEMSDLVGELERLTPRRLQMLQPSSIGLYLVWQFTLHLLAKGAILPQVFTIENTTLVRWLPATLDAAVDNLLEQIARQLPDVLLTTYGVVRSDVATLKTQHWRLVAADEAQNLKNAGAAQTKAAKSIPADAFIALSGTPVENRLSEYWSIMDFALRGYLGPLKTFVAEIEKPIQTDRDQQAAERFRRITAPFLLRRLKSDKNIISDLPEKIETDRFCELTSRQAAIYESVVREGMRVIRGESDAFQRQGLVLQMIMALKQVCNHPAQYLKNDLVDTKLSGKAQLLFDLLDSIAETDEKTLIFTQFKEMGVLLQNWLAVRYGEKPLFLHGGLSRKNRDEQVERFQNDRSVRHFILSLKAGGTGLNLTAASQAIHYDLWWNPAVEAQATDRAYRIGQQRNVQVHRLLTRETFEERINEIISNKKALVEMTVSSGEQWLSRMTDDELDGLFRLR